MSYSTKSFNDFLLLAIGPAPSRALPAPVPKDLGNNFWQLPDGQLAYRPAHSPSEPQVAKSLAAAREQGEPAAVRSLPNLSRFKIYRGLASGHYYAARDDRACFLLVDDDPWELTAPDTDCWPSIFFSRLRLDSAKVQEIAESLLAASFRVDLTELLNL